VIAHYLFIAETTQMGKGVFTAEKISKNTVIEIAPVVVMSGEERKLLDLALGWVSMYNHSYESNCEYDMDDDSKTITIRTVRPIMAGEELYINYNGVWNSDKKVWFDAR